MTEIWLSIDDIQRPHHEASAQALSVSDTPVVDVKAPLSDVPSASFQLPDQAINASLLSIVEASHASVALALVPVSFRVNEACNAHTSDDTL